MNLQDCATLVNYDPPGGADVLFQRVGRVLRMTNDPTREVHVYTLVPTIMADTGNQTRAAQSIRQLFDRITQRHEKSKSITGSAVYTTGAQADILLAGDIAAADFILQDDSLSDIGGLGAKSFLTHNATLERFHGRAAALADYLLSSRVYAAARPRLIVLLQQPGQRKLICYDPTRKQLDDQLDLQILDWLACSEKEPNAPIAAARIEHTANEAVQLWCRAQQIDVETVSKLCAVYLLPKRARTSSTKQLFTDIKKELVA